MILTNITKRFSRLFTKFLKSFDLKALINYYFTRGLFLKVLQDKDLEEKDFATYRGRIPKNFNLYVFQKFPKVL